MRLKLIHIGKLGIAGAQMMSKGTSSRVSRSMCRSNPAEDALELFDGFDASVRRHALKIV